MKLAIGSDHGGYELKCEICRLLREKKIEVVDCGTYSAEPIDYPDLVMPVCGLVSDDCELGILLCGTGIGMSIAANKVKGIRAALCHSVYDAQMAREHNDANVLCIGARTTPEDVAIEIVDAFLKNTFQGGRHAVRVDKLMKLGQR